MCHILPYTGSLAVAMPPIGVKCGWQRNVCVATNSLESERHRNVERRKGAKTPKTLWSTNAYNKQHAELEQVSSCVTNTVEHG